MGWEKGKQLIPVPKLPHAAQLRNVEEVIPRGTACCCFGRLFCF